MKVTFGGTPVQLAGTEIHVGDTIADFSAVKNDLSPFKLSEIKGRKLIVAVPSLDTSVCDAEVRRFNTEATKLKDVTVITVSMDLPFAQARWCGAAGVENVITVSDYKDRDFAHTFGAYLPNVGLIARSIFLLDENNTVKYVQYVPEVTDHPNYEAALTAVRT
ncbi:MAG: thiol peroxidase [Spirochaetae bacterium HGW-Spirochaetae-4]|nr:MAG: lipid hydroperoxide peroxidase [Spirochaetes bacterium GWC2_52_13]PKL21831.1 MAG: thiol peroxidase [Spirochaetae bacterium HGW-Spirochaetae-4]HCS36394.1 thiol peroxidase [Sphaerochaeta sp.]